MRLSEYCDENERKWNNEEINNANKLVEYLNTKIDRNLYEVAKTNDNLEVYKYLCIWLLNFYKEELINGLKNIGITYENFEKTIITSLILSVTRESSNVDFLINVFKSNNVIKDIIKYDEGKYKLLTNNYGEIFFSKADKCFEGEIETINYIKNYGDKIIDGCHEITFYLIKKYKNYKAITSICTMSLNKKYYHSFILNDDEVIDFTSNLIMKKDDYYKLNNVIELSVLDYSEYLNKKDESIDYDESKTLFGLLRIALYNQYKKGDNPNE